ncbi:hypothetical protein, partial [Proteiniclasticum ruminis]|uniref:hypothetical protein n=1 Tax=Proteiniclasticum ruminis TaxID=398199 RepID=UPI0028A68F16
ASAIHPTAEAGQARYGLSSAIPIKSLLHSLKTIPALQICHTSKPPLYYINKNRGPFVTLIFKKSVQIQIITDF